MAELVDALDSKSSFFGSVGSIPTQGTLRDKSSFLGLSLFLFFRFTLLNWVILCKMGWYQSIYQLAQGDITRYNKITKLNLHECLMAIELKKDKAEANKKNIKSKFD